jgi:hypothetical protein
VSDKEIKVTDKRMFMPDGALREEYRFLDEKSTAVEEETPATSAASATSAAPAAPATSPAWPESPARPDPRSVMPSPEPPEPAASAASARLEIPGTPPELGAPTFYDLGAILAEPVALYLGDLELEEGQSAENLEMARMHLDLLDVLRQKTMGNLTAQESAFLEDLLYRLRVRYVQKRG